MDAFPIYSRNPEFVAEPVPRQCGETCGSYPPPGANPRARLGWQSATVVICRTSLDRQAESVPLLVPRWRTTARKRRGGKRHAAGFVSNLDRWPGAVKFLKQTRGSLLHQCLMSANGTLHARKPRGDDPEWLEATVRQECRAVPVPTLLREEIGRRGE